MMEFCSPLQVLVSTAPGAWFPFPVCGTDVRSHRGRSAGMCWSVPADPGWMLERILCSYRCWPRE